MPCIDCGHPRASRVALKGAPILLEQCDRCDLIYRSDWHAEFQADLYEYYAPRLSWPEEEVYPPLNAQRIAGVLGQLRRHVEGERLLDVGCGAGGLVHSAVREGWDALGIDLSSAAIELAEHFGVPCRQQDFFHSGLDRERFDVIVMSEFIEHVPAPSRFLSRAAQLLEPSGVLYVTTPNFASLGRRVLGGDWRAIHPEHLSYFTPQSLTQAAASSGLHAVGLWTTNLSLAAIKKLMGRPVSRGEVSSLRADEQGCRETIEQSASLRMAKKVTNAVLRVTGTGESMRALFRGFGSKRGVRLRG